MDLPHVVVARTVEEKNGGLNGKGGSIHYGEEVVREFPNLREALLFARKRLESGETEPHEDFINLKDTKIYGSFSAFNALSRYEE